MDKFIKLVCLLLAYRVSDLRFSACTLCYDITVAPVGDTNRIDVDYTIVRDTSEGCDEILFTCFSRKVKPSFNLRFINSVFLNFIRKFIIIHCNSITNRSFFVFTKPSRERF